MVKFKGTNLYMNEIEVAEKIWKVEDLALEKFGLDGEDLKFDKNKSVFRLLKEDTEETLKKMFELDFSYTKINRVVKNNEEELMKIKGILADNYARIKNIYLNSIINSDYPVLSLNDFTILCQKIKIVDKASINISTIDRIFIATNVNFHNQAGTVNADRDLHRYEFLEILVRLALAKFKDTGVCKTPSEALEKFLAEHFFPNLEEAFTKPFRDELLFTYLVN